MSSVLSTDLPEPTSEFQTSVILILVNETQSMAIPFLSLVKRIVLRA